MLRAITFGALSACSFTPGALPTDRQIDAAVDSFTGSCPSNWHDPAWPSRKLATIDPSKVAGTLADFPVLLAVTDAAWIGATPEQFVITAGDGTTKLAHEVERFDPATGALTTWVRIPALAPDQTSTKLFIYWGNDDAVDQANPTGVWSAGFAAVFHLSEVQGPGVQSRDSTSNARHATSQNMLAANQVDGKIAGSLTYFDTNDRIATASFTIGSAFTLEAWVQPASLTNEWRCIVNNDPSYNRWLGLRNTDVDFYDGGEHIIASGVTTGTSWYHIAVTYDGANLIGYRNGSAAAPVAATLPASGSAPLQIGYTASPSWPNEWFQGRIDEVRVSSIVRPAAYMTTSFANQSDPSSFLTVATTAESCVP